MNNKIMDLLKQKDYTVPRYLLKNFNKYGLDSNMVLIMIYLLNSSAPIICDYKKIGDSVGVENIMELISTLADKRIIEIKMKKNSEGKLEEYIDLDIFYNKVLLSIIDEKEEEPTDIYSTFESEFGRTLSPIEYELINGWTNTYKEEIILEALKESVYNGVTNFRYIDKILFEWNKKGIDSIDKISKNKKEYKKTNAVEVPDYDWLNNE